MLLKKETVLKQYWLYINRE